MQSLKHIDKIEEYIYKSILKKELKESDLVQLIERINTYLNLKTISNYSKDSHISYNGAKNHRDIITLFGCKFIADNH